MAEPHAPVAFFLLRDAARIGFQLRVGGGAYLTAVRRAAAVTVARALLDDDEDASAERVSTARSGHRVPEMEVILESAMQTPDRGGRVEVVRRRGQHTRWYRIVRGDDDAVLDRLPIAAVQRILTQAGVDLATLVPVRDAAVEHPQPGQRPAAGQGAA